LNPFLWKGEGKPSRNANQQEIKKELKKEKHELETKEGLFLAFSTNKSRGKRRYVVFSLFFAICLLNFFPFPNFHLCFFLA
jgi:hypothetical protein